MLSCLSCVPFFATLWTVAFQASLSMGFSQARILERAAISFSRGSSRSKDRTQISCIGSRFFASEPPGKPESLYRHALMQTSGKPIFQTRKLQLTGAVGLSKQWEAAQRGGGRPVVGRSNPCSPILSWVTQESYSTLFCCCVLLLLLLGLE